MAYALASHKAPIINEPDPHWPNERHAPGLLHPPPVIITPFIAVLDLVRRSQRTVLTTKILLLKEDIRGGGSISFL